LFSGKNQFRFCGIPAGEIFIVVNLRGKILLLAPLHRLTAVPLPFQGRLGTIAISSIFRKKGNFGGWFVSKAPLKGELASPKGSTEGCPLLILSLANT